MLQFGNFAAEKAAYRRGKRRKNMNEYTHISHELLPVYDKNSRLLILGSLPSVKSRESGFYYGHPKNRFWRVLSLLFSKALPETVPEKKELLLSSGVALWDVIAECDIKGSSDASIKNVKTNDISLILDNSRVSAVFLNGRTAGNIFKRYMEGDICRPGIVLPSTSPANASCSLERLTEEWSVILKSLS